MEIGNTLFYTLDLAIWLSSSWIWYPALTGKLIVTEKSCIVKLFDWQHKSVFFNSTLVSYCTRDTWMQSLMILGGSKLLRYGVVSTGFHLIFLVAFLMGNFFSKVAHRLSKEAKPVAIYSSDLKRAAETAQTIARICNVPNVCPFYSSPLMLCGYFSMACYFCDWKYTDCTWFSCL